MAKVKEEYFMGAWVSEDGAKVCRLTRNGRSTKSTVNLYLDGSSVPRVFVRERDAKRAGLKHIKS